MTVVHVAASAPAGRATPWSALGGVVRYEFPMQVRRRTLWIGFLLFGVFVFVA